jgi:hypothetical protein
MSRAQMVTVRVCVFICVLVGGCLGCTGIEVLRTRGSGRGYLCHYARVAHRYAGSILYGNMVYADPRRALFYSHLQYAYDVHLPRNTELQV